MLVQWADAVYKEDVKDDCPVIQFSELATASVKMNDVKLETKNPILEVNIGSTEDPRPTYVSSRLSSNQKGQLLETLKEYKDCFAQDYRKCQASTDRSLSTRYRKNLDIDDTNSCLTLLRRGDCKS